jgi:hypothetical protein
VALEVSKVPATDEVYEKMLRLKLHLERGGQVTLSGGHVLLAARYTICTLAPDTKPTINFSDRTCLEYTFGVVLKSLTSISEAIPGEDTETSIGIRAGQYITVEVIAAETSGAPESLTVNGAIEGIMFQGVDPFHAGPPWDQLVGMVATFGPAAASGSLRFHAWHQIIASGAKGHISWDTPGGPYTVGLEDGYGDGDFNDIILTVTVSDTPPNPPTVMDPIPTNNEKRWRILLGGILEGFTDPEFYTQNNTGFTLESGEGTNGGIQATHWYWWRAPGLLARDVTVNVTGVPSVINVYHVTGDLIHGWDFSDFSLVVSSNTGSATFVYSVTEFYVIQVGSQGAGARGVQTIAIDSEIAGPPENDDFANRTTISGSSGSLSPVSNINSTIETDEPVPDGQDATVWFEWTAPSSDGVILNASDPFYGDCYIGVYTGSAVDALTLVADTYGECVFLATAGTVYKIQIWAPTSVTDITLTWDMPAPALTSIEVTPNPFTIVHPGTQQMTADGKDQWGQPIATGAITWTSTNTPKMTVDSSGLVTSVAVGNSLIRATHDAIVGTAVGHVV